MGQREHALLDEQDGLSRLFRRRRRHCCRRLVHVVVVVTAAAAFGITVAISVWRNAVGPYL